MIRCLPALAPACAMALVVTSATAQFPSLDRIRPKVHLPTVQVRASTCFLVDLNQDNSAEAVVGFRDSDAQVWFNTHGVFGPALDLPDSQHVQHIRAADMDGDGDLDFIATGFSAGYYRNDGLGTFVDVSAGLLNMQPGPGAVHFELVDIDGDGDVDALFSGTFLRVMVNNGTGQLFEAPSQSPNVPIANGSFAVADFDGDGDLDVLTQGFGGQGIFVNDGTGTYTFDPSLVPGGFPGSAEIRAADIDGDGDVDAILSGFLAQPLALRNDGTGLMVDDPTAFAGIQATGRAELADIDLDGDIDIVTTVGNEVLINDGTGNFSDQTATRLDISRRATGASLGDVDGDGDVDLLVSRDDEELPAVLFLNDGTGHFANAMRTRIPAHGGSPNAIEVGDIDGDGQLDLVVGAHAGFAGPAIQLLRGNGAAEFAEFDGGIPRVGFVEAIALLDVAGDGTLDIVSGDDISVLGLWTNDGSGNFSDSSSSIPASGIASVTAIATGDLDGDGLDDILVGTGAIQPEQNRLYLQTAGGTFIDATATALPISLDGTNDIELVDVNGDQSLDAIIANSDGDNALWINDGTGVFTAQMSALPLVAGYTTDIAVGDLDLDGDVDVLVLSDTDQMFANNGFGGFTPAITGLVPQSSGSNLLAEIGDIDGDSDLDVITVHATGPGTVGYRFYRNDGLAGFVEWSGLPFDEQATATRALALVDIDGDTDLDVISTGWDGSRLFLNSLWPHLQSRFVPRAGFGYSLRVVGMSGQQTAWLLSTGALPSPVDTPFGKLRIDPSLAIVFAAPLNTFETMIPANSSLAGLTLHWQAVRTAAPGLGPVLRLTDMVVDQVQF